MLCARHGEREAVPMLQRFTAAANDCSQLSSVQFVAFSQLYWVEEAFEDGEHAASVFTRR